MFVLGGQNKLIVLVTGFSNNTKQCMLAGYENSCQTRTATYEAGMSVFLTIIYKYIFISCIIYRLFSFTSRNCISSCLLITLFIMLFCTLYI